MTLTPANPWRRVEVGRPLQNRFARFSRLKKLSGTFGLDLAIPGPLKIIVDVVSLDMAIEAPALACQCIHTCV